MRNFSLSIKRTLNSPVEKVFVAWTEPENIKQWLSPGAYKTVDSQIKLNKDGEYKIVMQEPSGKMHYMIGTIKEFVRNEKLVFSWVWEGNSMGPDERTLVTVLFSPLSENQTELTLIHENFADEQNRNGHNQGWSDALDKLETYLQITAKNN